MMKLEKALAQTDLGVFGNAPAQIMAKEILRYQKFSVGAALEKINRTSYSASTAKILLQQGFRYLETGTYNPHTGFKRVAQYIDELKNRISPLTPAADEARKIRKRRSDFGATKVVKQAAVLPIVNMPTDITEKFEYFVQINDDRQLHIWNTASECSAFIAGLQATCRPAKIITGHLVRSDVRVIDATPIV